MNEIRTSCAPTDQTISSWESIDWTKCELEVRKLQARIVKVQKEGRYGKVKALQWLLTHSFAAKALAVKRVTSNKGKNTSGVDKVLWSTPIAKANAITELKRRDYNPMPLKRVNIRKSNGKLRPLGIPTMKDRAMQALYLMALDPVAETTADNHSYGFRKERCTGDAIHQCYINLSKESSPQWILEGDIKGCFDHINHEWLLNNIPMDKVMLRKWLKSGFIFNKQLFPTEEGTPQGGIISPTLANMALNGLQTMLEAKFHRVDLYSPKRSYYPKVHFIRYADDFIITSISKEMLEQEIMPMVKEFLQARGLTLSEEKTKITHIDEGFDFLGFNIRKYKGKFLITPSKESQKKFQRKINEIVNSHKTIPQESLIRLLNPIITGSANYYQHVVSGKVFQKMDFHIYQKLLQWSLRRHPAKGKWWVAERYFHKHRGRSWVFAAPFDKDGRQELYPIKWLTDTKITRYAKLKCDANPYDPDWTEYFEKRETRLMLQSAKGRNTIVRIWKRQQRKCPYCGEPITRNTPWRVSEKVVHGKTERMLVHSYCNRNFELLEPYDAKVSCTVLRGERGSNTPDLPDKAYYDALKSVHDLVKGARKVQQTILLVGDISDIYVTNFNTMTGDPNFTVEELSAIAFGYNRLLKESSDLLLDLKEVTTATGLSMTDKERLDIINRIYGEVLEYKNLTWYYTRKNIGVSYLRSKEKGDAARVLSLYGTHDQRYW